MLQRLSPWLAAGLTTGLVILAGFWLIGAVYFNTFILGQRAQVDQRLMASVVDASLKNPEVQQALKNQVTVYLKSPEGKAKMAELLKSPEMVKAMSDNIQSPEMRGAILKLMEVPEFRASVLNTIKDTPEMKLLTLLSSSITLEPETANTKPQPAGPSR